MGERLPQLRAREVIRVLKRFSYVEDHQTGSHLILRHLILRRSVPIPIHPRPLDRSLTKGIIKQAGLTVSEFLKLLRR